MYTVVLILTLPGRNASTVAVLLYVHVSHNVGVAYLKFLMLGILFSSTVRLSKDTTVSGRL